MNQHHDPLWAGSPSQLINAGYFGLMAITAGLLAAAAVVMHRALPQSGFVAFLMPLVPLAMAAWRYANTRAIQYTVVDQRIFFRFGILDRVTHQIELFRVRDFVLDEPIALRVFGLGNVRIISADQATPEMLLHAIPEAASVASVLREAVMSMRQQYGVRELEVGGT